MSLRLVMISDTHERHRQIEVPDGDVLVCAGDFTGLGDPWKVEDFSDWLGTLPHRHKLVIAGNHELTFDSTRRRTFVPGIWKALTNAVYLQDTEVVIDGFVFYGSPWQPEFYDWAFNLPRGEPLAEKWALIPPDTDVLITHGPPKNILDYVPRGEHVGCEELAKRVAKVKPQVHVFGHIHYSHGTLVKDGITYVNASICTEAYKAKQAPIVVDLDQPRARRV